MADHSRLGRGLASLMGDVGDETAPVQADSGRKPRRAPIENLKANPRNPRRNFTETELNELAESIKERGIIQPIVVRGVHGAPDHYEIIAGERRWRAAQRAGLHDVPIAVVEATDAQALEFAIIENVQRADLNAIEEAAGYLALMEEFKHSQDDVAQIVGKSRPHVANTLRLLRLPAPVQALVQSGQLSAGHARLLVASRKPSRSRTTSSRRAGTCASSRPTCARTARARRATCATRPRATPAAPRTPTPARWSGGCRTLWDWK